MGNWKNSKEELPEHDEVVIIITPCWKEYIIARYNKNRELFENIYDSYREYYCSEKNIEWCRIPEYDLKK